MSFDDLLRIANNNRRYNILINISKLPVCKIEYLYEMWTEVPDILQNDFHVTYKYFTHQKIAKVP